MRIRIQSYSPRSRSAKALSKATGFLRLKTKTAFVPRPDDRVINWGSADLRFPEEHYLNSPLKVAVAQNKLHAFEVMRGDGVRVPSFTVDRGEAQEWSDNGSKVVERHLLRGSAGRGIVLRQAGDELGRARLYVKYIPKKSEYRIHVWGGEIFDVQQKKTRHATSVDCDYQIRNKDAGWVFCREGVEAPSEVRRQAVLAVKALGLDFGAVDIGWTENTGRATVYEVNTAAGLEGTTLELYKDAARSSLLAGGAIVDWVE